jgi:Uma2 family endonuclease
MRLPEDGRKRELVDGEIHVSPAGIRHGRVGILLAARLLLFARDRRLGEVFDPSTGFRLPSGNVRSPDVSFVQRDRMPAGAVPEGFGELAPDLVVEILSPEDNPCEVLDKIGEYLAAGSRLAWVMDPGRRRAAVHRSLTEVRQLAETDSLDGEDVLPGFRCRLAEVLD